MLQQADQRAIVYSMQRASGFDRQNISSELADTIRSMIVDGVLPPGSRLNEVHLARDLGVSRTPLREALARLGREGTLSSVPRIGWFVKPLTLEEFDQLYAMRPLLDPEALRFAGLPAPERIKQLDRLNSQIAEADDADRIIDLDDRFHLLLIADCPNQILLDVIHDIIRRTRRYEVALMRNQANVAVATANHRAILAALRRGDLEGAVDALRGNLQSGYEPIRNWLVAREGGAE